MTKQFLTGIDLNGQKVEDMGAPTVASDATTKGYVDARTSGAGLFFGFDFDTTTTAGAAATRLRLNNASPTLGHRGVRQLHDQGRCGPAVASAGGHDG